MLDCSDGREGLLEAGCQISVFRLDCVREKAVKQLEAGFQVHGRLLPGEASVVCAAG